MSLSRKSMTNKPTLREAFLNELYEADISTQEYGRLVNSFKAYEQSLSKELVEKIEAGRDVSKPEIGAPFNDYIRAGNNAAKDEDIAIIKATLEAQTDSV